MGVKPAPVLGEKYRLWIFEDWVLKCTWIQGKGSGMILEKTAQAGASSFRYILHKIVHGGRDGSGMWHALRKAECVVCSLGNLM